MFVRLSMRGNHYYSSCVQCLGVSGTLQHLLLLLRRWAMILLFSHSPFLHWSIVCSSLTPLSWWAQTHLLSTFQTSWTRAWPSDFPTRGRCQQPRLQHKLLCSQLAPHCSNYSSKEGVGNLISEHQTICYLPDNVTNKEVDSSSSVTWLLVEAIDLLWICY